MRDLALERTIGDRMVAFGYDIVRSELGCQCCGSSGTRTEIGRGLLHHGVYVDLHRDPWGRVSHRFGCIVVTCGSAYCGSRVQAIGEARANCEARMSQHPSEPRGDLSFAAVKTRRMVDDATKRGDLTGADAWRLALQAIELAERTFDDARTRQDWTREPGR